MGHLVWAFYLVVDRSLLSEKHLIGSDSLLSSEKLCPISMYEEATGEGTHFHERAQRGELWVHYGQGVNIGTY